LSDLDVGNEYRFAWLHSWSSRRLLSIGIWLKGAFALRTLEVNLLSTLVNSGLAALLVSFDLLHDVACLVLLLPA